MSDDTICLSCSTPGACCFHEVIAKGKRIATDHCCGHLDLKTGKCKIYKTRQEDNPNCYTLEEMIKEGTVPKWCLYIKDDEAYQEREDTRLYDFAVVDKFLHGFWLKNGKEVMYDNNLKSIKNPEERINIYNISIRTINKAKSKETKEVKDREKPKRTKRRVPRPINLAG